MDLDTVKEQVGSFLDSLPLGTLIALTGIGCVIWGYASGSIDIDEAFKYLGLSSGSAAAVGIMRTHAGKGVR